MADESHESILTISEKEECLRAKVYIHDFSSRSSSVRHQALNQIKKLSTPVKKIVFKKLLSQEADVFKQIEILGAIASSNGKEDGNRSYLRNYLINSNPEIRLSALRVISKFEDEETFEVLSMAVKDSDAGIRQESLKLLCRIYGLRALPAILHLLHDFDDAVRKTSITMCATFETRQAVPALITMLTDENTDIQKEVEHALEKITKHQEKTVDQWTSWWMEHQIDFK